MVPDLPASHKGLHPDDVSKIKSAKCEVLSNGNYKITIVLKADINPEPCDPKTGVISKGFTGTMFSPLAKAVSTTLSRTTQRHEGRQGC